MEQSTEFNLDLAIRQFLNTYRSKVALSEEDQDELLDHLYLEVEALQDAGLNEEEAFMVSQKRLGHIELITQEYQKARPWTGSIRPLIFTLIAVMGVKLLLNILNMGSFASILAIHEFPIVNIDTYLQGAYWWVLLSWGIISLGLGGLILKRMSVIDLKTLWPLPLIYIISEGSNMGIKMALATKMGPAITGTIIYTSSIMTIIISIISVLIVSVLLFRYKHLKLQFA